MVGGKDGGRGRAVGGRKVGRVDEGGEGNGEGGI